MNRQGAIMFNPKMKNLAPSTRNKRERAKERFAMKIKMRHSLNNAPGIGIMLPGKVRKHRKIDHFKMTEENHSDTSDPDLFQYASSYVKYEPGPDTSIVPVPKPNVQVHDVDVKEHFHAAPKRTGPVGMQELIDKIVARRRNVCDRYMDDRYRLYRGRRSDSEKTPMVIRSYEPPKAPFAIQHNRVKKLVFISPQRIKYKSGQSSSIMVIDNPITRSALLEKDEDALLERQRHSNRTEELVIKTWQPQISPPRKHTVHLNPEDRHVRNYKLERQVGMRMEGYGQYSDMHFSSQSRILPPIKIPCQPVYPNHTRLIRREHHLDSESFNQKRYDSSESYQHGDENEHINTVAASNHNLDHRTDIINSTAQTALRNFENGSYDSSDHGKGSHGAHYHGNGSHDPHDHDNGSHGSHDRRNGSHGSHVHGNGIHDSHDHGNGGHSSQVHGNDRKVVTAEDVKLEVKGENIPNHSKPEEESNNTTTNTHFVKTDIRIPGLAQEIRVPTNTPTFSDAGDSDDDDDDNDDDESTESHSCHGNNVEDGDATHENENKDDYSKDENGLCESKDNDDTGSCHGNDVVGEKENKDKSDDIINSGVELNQDSEVRSDEDSMVDTSGDDKSHAEDSNDNEDNVDDGDIILSQRENSQDKDTAENPKSIVNGTT